MGGSREELKERFFAAVEGAPSDRAAALEAIEDPALRRELLVLLQAHDAVSSFLEVGSQTEVGAKPTLSAGQQLGPYEVLHLIGRGGMGEVYRACDIRLGRHVALKILPAALRSDATRQQRFDDEARVAGALNHPNVMTLYDVGTLDDGSDTRFIVMELLEGETLRTRLERDGALPREHVIDYGIQVARGLTAAHAAGIVHRDLKPENLFITVDGRVKILDFGIAKLAVLTDAGTVATEPGMIIGTAGYMAPEQVRGDSADARSDIFAFGAVLFEMIVGKRAFNGQSAIETLGATLYSDPLQKQWEATQADPALFGVVRKCIEKAPDKRYQCSAEVVAAVEELSIGRPQSRFFRSLGMIGAAAVLAVVCAVGIIWGTRSVAPSVAPTKAPRPDAVFAVLPFDTIAADESQRFLAAGITEEISAHLGRASSLRLMSRAAVSSYAAAPDAGRRLRNDLGVGRLITGSVRMVGDRVRVSVQLADTDTGQIIWAQQYDGLAGDILKLQGDVARYVSDALMAELSHQERVRLNQASTTNPEAYELYLRARGKRASAESIAMVQEAVRLDPRFGAAFALMARMQGVLGEFGDPQLLADALNSAQQAIRVAPNEARGHHALGVIQLRRGRLADARLAFRRALDLSPSFADAAWDLSITDATLGRFDESLFWARQGFTLAPNVSVAFYHLAVPLLFLADVRASDEWLHAADRLFPTAPRIQYMLSESEFLTGKGQAAESRVRKALAARPDDPELQAEAALLLFLRKSGDARSRIETAFKQSPTARGYLLPETFRTLHAYLLLQTGDSQAATVLLDESLRAARKQLDEGSELPEVPLEMAAIHALRGERAEALQWFNAAYRAGWRLFREIDNDPLFSRIRQDPEFVRIRRKMEEDVAAMRARVNFEDNPRIPPAPSKQ